MKKRILAVLLSGIMSISALAGCSKEPATDPSAGATGPASGTEAGAQTKTDELGMIGMSMPTRDQFWTSVETAFSDYAKANSIEVSTLEANYDIATQISHVQTWEADGYSAAIVGLVNNDAAEDVLKVAGDMKIVFVNRQPNLDLLQDGKVVYVGTDETLYGIEQGNFLAKYFKEKNQSEINVAFFLGQLGLDNTIKRTESAKKALADNGLKVNVIFENTAEWDRGKAMDQFSQFMGSGEKIDAVICNNDEMALGVIEAMQINGDKTVFCPVVGIDATDVGCQAIKAGTMACSVFQDPVAQGEGSLKCAIGLVKGEKIEGLVDNYYNIEPTLVSPENVENFIK